MIRDFGNLKLVEIEIFNYCNRTCNYCPNKTIDRKSVVIELLEECFLNTLRELKDQDFKGYITFSRYNEPLSQDELLKKRANQVREFLPGVTLIFNTNGDFLTKRRLDGLDVDEISVMDYDNKGAEKCKKRLERAGADITEIDYPFIKGVRDNIKFLYYVDFVENHTLWNDRGGTLEELSLKERRTEPCLEPDRFIGIDYNGNIMPCCVTRSDIDSHQDFILGNIKEQSVMDIFNSERATTIRKKAMDGNFDDSMKPCYHCPYELGRYRRDDVILDYERGLDYK
jgi:radical SAM protein with 4Fe4S-binding SPASM domain